VLDFSEAKQEEVRIHMARARLIQRVALILFLAGLVSVADAQDPKPTGDKPDVEAMYLLRHMAQYLSEAQQLRVRITSGYDVVQPSGRKIEFREARWVTLVRPSKIRIDVERDDGKKNLVLFDGNDILAYDPGRKIMATTARPGDIDGAMKYFIKDLKMRIPLALLFTANFPAEIEARGMSAEIVQRVTIFDVPCLQVATQADNVDFQVWIPEKGQPLPRRIVITYRNETGQPQYWADFSHWSLAPNPPQSTFAFKPPKGTERVPFLGEIVNLSGTPAGKGGR
jgi:hypothetical protein